MQMPVLHFAFLLGLSAFFGAAFLLSFIYDDSIPWPLSRLRQELLALRTMVRIRRTSNRTIEAMVAEARRHLEGR